MKLSTGFEGRKARIDMVSMMDVMFLILVFFVYSIFSMSVHRGIKVNLPSVAGKVERGERIIISVTAKNELSLNRKPLPLEELIAEATQLSKTTQHPVMISADREASLGIGIELLGKLKQNGIEHVAFQVEEKRPDPKQ